jgi:outer membrane protein assembly factor BamB
MTDDGDVWIPQLADTPTRRTVLGLAGAGVVGAVGLGELSARTSLELDVAVPDDEWHVPGRDSRQTSTVPSAELRGEPREVWSLRLGERRLSDHSVPPLVVGEAVVFAHGHSVSAFDAASGTRRWTWASPRRGWYRGQVLVVGETVVVVGPERVRGLALDSGRQRWVFGRPVHERACRVGDAVAVVSEGADGDRLTLLDAATGKPHWRVGGRAGPAPLCLLDGTLFAVHGSQVVAFDPVDGTELFAVDAPLSSAAGLPYGVAAADGTVFFGMQPAGPAGDIGVEDPRVVAVDSANGEVTWTTDLDGDDGAVGSPQVAVSGGTLYGANSQADQVFALDVVTGERRWSAVLYGANGAVVVGDRVVARSDEAVVTVDAATGERVAAHELDDPGYGEMAYGDGRLYVRHDETLTALSW